MNDFLSLLDELGIRHLAEGHHHCRVGWEQLDCPFCGRDSDKWHLGFSLEGNYLNCYKCGWHSMQETIAEFLNISFAEAYKLVSNLDLPQAQIKVKKKGRLILPDGVGPLGKAHKRYLEERGFNPERLERLWGLQGIGISTELSWRIFIPIHYNGEMVSWTTRSISHNAKLRYRSADSERESANHRQLLYGEGFSNHSIIIHEGPADVWRVGPGAVATFGIDITKAQIRRMVRYPNRYVCFDNEKDAQNRASELADVLSLYPGNTYNITLDSKDAGSASMKEIKRLRKVLR